MQLLWDVVSVSSSWWVLTTLHSGKANCRDSVLSILPPHCEARGCRPGCPIQPVTAISPPPSLPGLRQSWLSTAWVPCMCVSRCLLWLPLPTCFRPNAALLSHSRPHTSLHNAMLSGLSPPSGPHALDGGLWEEYLLLYQCFFLGLLDP